MLPHLSRQTPTPTLDLEVGGVRTSSAALGPPNSKYRFFFRLMVTPFLGSLSDECGLPTLESAGRLPLPAVVAARRAPCKGNTGFEGMPVK